MAEAILQLEEVTKRFDRTLAADRLSLTVHRGEFFTFLGPSGSGKSTILRMIAGLERPDAGRILIAGRDVEGVPPWRRNLGMVFQHYAIFPHMTVAQNVGYGLRVRRRPAVEIGEKVARLLTLVGLAGMAAKNVTPLTGGEPQRVALARAPRPDPALPPLAACEPGRARVTIGGAPVMVSLDGVTLPEGSRLAVALRAEHVRVGRAAAACQARLDAVLVEVIYRGTNVDHVLELPDGQRLVATSTQREAEGAGQAVTCGFDAGDVILLER